MTTDSMTMAYRLFVPEGYDESKSYPLVLALHGAGARGDDNESHIRSHRLATSWADPVNQSEWPAFVVAPQLPQGLNWFLWLDLNDYEVIGPRPATFTAMAILDSLESEFSIDPDRIYVTGISAGGVGSWGLPLLDPGRFAAAVPMSSGYFYQFADRLADLPLWIVHGEMDDHAPAKFSRTMIASFMDMGRSVLFTECGFDPSVCDPVDEGDFAAAMGAHTDLVYTGYETGRHEGSIWNRSYNDRRLTRWVFAQHRRIEDGIRITAPTGYPIWSGTVDVTWDVTEETESGELWLSIDNGESWALVDSSVTNNGSVALHTDLFEDTPFARVRLLFKDQEGFVHRREDSTPFVIDNGENGVPFVRLTRLPLVLRDTWETDSLELSVLLGDAERGDLVVDVSFSSDGGLNYNHIKTAAMRSAEAPQSIRVDPTLLGNSDRGVFRVAASDGVFVGQDRSSPIPTSSDADEIPATIRAAHSFPNPFAQVTTIRFELERPATTELSVYDALGRLVASLKSGFLTSGLHEVEWDAGATDYAPGLYFYRLSSIENDGSRSTSVGSMTLVD